MLEVDLINEERLIRDISFWGKFFDAIFYFRVSTIYTYGY
jgi:hypothetical protein